MLTTTIMRLSIAMLLLSHCFLVLAYVVCGGLYFVSSVYGPTLELHHLEEKFGLGNCGPTTDFLEDLIIHQNMSQHDALDLARLHGSAIVPSVLSKETANTFREYVMDANGKLESAFVLSQEHRHRIMPPHTESIVQQAFKEIFQHSTLRPLIDSLVGPEASLTAFSVITSQYGAKQQGFHSDTGSSSAKYPHLFVPEYTLAIPLQDTTRAMGATGLCPGTHVCEQPDCDYDAMEKLFFDNETLAMEYDDSFYTYIHHNVPCKVFAEIRQGDALIYNTDTWHSGGKHTAEEERAVVFISFASSRQGPHDNRSLPHGKVYSLDWRMWGQTIDDLVSIKERPWRVWHTVGLFNGKQNIRPWTLIDAFLQIYKEEQGIAHFIANDFDSEHMQNVANILLIGLIAVGGIYVMVSFPLALSACWYLRRMQQTFKCRCECFQQGALQNGHTHTRNGVDHSQQNKS